MKKIITFTSEWNTISKKIIDFLEDKSKTHEFTWKNYEFSNFRTFAKEYGVEAPQTCLLVEDEKIIKKTQGVFDENILSSWINDFAAPTIVEDAVLEVEPVVEVVLEAEAVVEAELTSDEAVEAVLEAVVEDKPIAEDDIPVVVHHEPVTIIDLIDDSVIFDGAVFEDEFSSEDLGNDISEDVIDPEDLF